MPKLTKKRKAELLKQYPDGKAIGRVIIEDYLNGERGKRGFHKTKDLPDAEIAFLIESLTRDEDITGYNIYVNFRNAIYTLMNMVDCTDNLFLCGHFYALYLIHTVMMGLSVYVSNPDFPSDAHKKNCKIFLKEAEDGLETGWENMKHALQALYVYDACLKIIGEIHNFNLDAIRPDLKNRSDGFFYVQHEVGSLYRTIKKYQDKTQGKRGKINISHKFIELLDEIMQDSYINIQDNSDFLESLANMLDEVYKVNIPTVHTITGIISNTPLHWGGKVKNG